MNKKTSTAQLKAIKKYDSTHYKSIACKCKVSDYELYQQYANNQNINSMSGLLNKAVKYCIDNNIDLTSTNQESLTH